MIDAALASDDPQTVAAIISVARQTNPDSIAEIDAIASEIDRRREAAIKAKAAAKREKLATADVFSLWTGEIELGGSLSTGNSRTVGAFGALKLKRSGLDWQHDISVRADYQEADGDASTERAVAAWQPRYKLGESYYVFGLAQYEHDRFLGYEHRLSAGLGLGVVAVNQPKMRLELDAGPVVRLTRFRNGAGDERRVAGRGGLNLKWTPWPRLSIAQELAVYVEKDNTTATSTSSLETELFGPLKARLSYHLQYERDVPPGKKTTDTISRASLVYKF